MMPRQTTLVQLAVFAAAMLPGCGRSSDDTPPIIRYGEQECDSCHMIISDDRYAAAIVIHAGGATRKLAFDDVGCLLAYSSDLAPDAKTVFFVKDTESRDWLDLRSAHLMQSTTHPTPMASGVGASVTVEGVDRLSQRFHGKRTSLAELQAAAGARVAASLTPGKE